MGNKNRIFPLISVIMPTLNEERCIEGTIESVRGLDGVELIVSDGGSSDRTVELCRSFGIKVIPSAPGRGPQMNCGADASKGDILLFLHADTLLPEGWEAAVRKALTEETMAGGAFSFALSGWTPALSFISLMVNLRSKVFGLPYGDQGIFMKRSAFEAAGGFRPLPIMEDLEMMRCLKRMGKICILPEAAITSSRRWEREGWLKTTVRNQFLLYLYLLGVSPERLYRYYRAVR